MFGPLSSIQNENLVLCPLYRGQSILDSRVEKCLSWLMASWELAGASVHIMDAPDHDRLASIHQIGTLISIMLHTHLIAQEKSIEKLSCLSTPNSRLLQECASHMLRPDRAHLNVYAQLITSNAFSEQIFEDATSFLINLRQSLTDKDRSIVQVESLLMRLSKSNRT